MSLPNHIGGDKSQSATGAATNPSQILDSQIRNSQIRISEFRNAPILSSQIRNSRPSARSAILVHVTNPLRAQPPIRYGRSHQSFANPRFPNPEFANPNSGIPKCADPEFANQELEAVCQIWNSSPCHQSAPGAATNPLRAQPPIRYRRSHPSATGAVRIRESGFRHSENDDP